MASPEEIPNIEQFPLSPRLKEGAALPGTREGTSSLPTRSFTPVKRAKVEFWHYGELPARVEKPTKPRRFNHARRADQLGILMLVFAVAVIVAVIVALQLNNRKYSFEAGAVPKTVTPDIEFYQGNRAFDRKVKEEKEGLITKEIPVQGASDDLEISLQAQMASMNDKLQKMRSQKLLEEPPLAQPGNTPGPVPIMGVSPAEMKKFNSPLEFNSMIPKSLQDSK